MGLDGGGSSRRVEKGERNVVGDDSWFHWRRDAGHVQYQSFMPRNEEGAHCPVLPQCPGALEGLMSDLLIIIKFTHLHLHGCLNSLRQLITYFVHLRKEGLAT